MEPLATVRPAYGSASLADVLPSILEILGVPGMVDRLGLADQLDGVRRVALLLVDGLGHQLLPLAAPVAPLLADVTAGRLGWLRPVTTAFPSTTPSGLTTLGTGAPPGRHGVVGFTVRVPGNGRILTHINWNADPDPASWQPLPTRFEQAAEAGVQIHAVGPPAFAGTGLTRAAYRGARYRPADGPDALAAAMLAALRRADPPSLVYGYHPDVDTAGHLSGVDSDAWRSAASDLDRLLTRLVTGLPGGSALLLTADHGQVDVPASQRFDLDADPRLRAGLEAVAGEPRVRYLHTAPGATADVLAAWREVLGDAAMVASREQVIAEGWFGPVAPAHLERIGDVVVTCRDRYAVLATAHEPERVSKLVAFHGSCTAAEMLVPLWVVRP